VSKGSSFESIFQNACSYAC